MPILNQLNREGPAEYLLSGGTPQSPWFEPPDPDTASPGKRVVGVSAPDVPNEAALLAARANGTPIIAAALEESGGSVIGGPVRLDHFPRRDLKITAYTRASTRWPC